MPQMIQPYHNPPIPDEIVPTIQDIEDPPAIPEEVGSIDMPDHTLSENDCPSDSRPRRNCKPPDKLTLKWDNTQSYE